MPWYRDLGIGALYRCLGIGLGIVAVIRPWYRPWYIVALV